MHAVVLPAKISKILSSATDIYWLGDHQQFMVYFC